MSAPPLLTAEILFAYQVKGLYALYNQIDDMKKKSDIFLNDIFLHFIIDGRMIVGIGGASIWYSLHTNVKIFVHLKKNVGRNFNFLLVTTKMATPPLFMTVE